MRLPRFSAPRKRSESASDGRCTGAAGVAGKPIDKEVSRHFFTPLEDPNEVRA